MMKYVIIYNTISNLKIGQTIFKVKIEIFLFFSFHFLFLFSFPSFLFSSLSYTHLFSFSLVFFTYFPSRPLFLIMIRYGQFCTLQKCYFKGPNLFKYCSFYTALVIFSFCIPIFSLNGILHHESDSYCYCFEKSIRSLAKESIVIKHIISLRQLLQKNVRVILNCDIIKNEEH